MKEANQSVFQTRVVFLTLALMVVVLDLVSKRLIVASFQLHEVRQIFGDWVRLTYIHNPGAAFGLFPGSRVPLIAISIVAVFVVVAVAWSRRNTPGTVVPLGLILGGAVGNLIDRIRLGEVVDFVQIGIPPNMYWPVFNVADSAVTIGVTWLAIGLVVSGRNARSETPLEEMGDGDEHVTGVASSRDPR